MTNKNSLEASIPPGFDLANYAGAVQMGAFGWYLNIKHRYYFYHEGGHDCDVFNGLISEDEMQNWRNQYAENSSHYFSEKNLRFGEVRSLSIYEAWNLGKELEHCKESLESLEQETNWEDENDEELEELKELRRELEEETELLARMEQYGYSFSKIALADEAAHTPIDSYFLNKREMFPGPYLAVDLSAPDSVLLKQFKRWLSAARAEWGEGVKPKPFSVVRFRNWAESRVLAYLDLVEWNRRCGRALTAKQIGLILFPELQHVDSPDPTDKIEKVTKRYARELMNNEIIYALFIQAHAEAGGHQP